MSAFSFAQSQRSLGVTPHISYCKIYQDKEEGEEGGGRREERGGRMEDGGGRRGEGGGGGKG